MQPVYVKSTGETSYPLLQKVLVAFGDKIAFEDTLDEALDVLFGGNSGATAGDTNVPTTGGGTTTPDRHRRGRAARGTGSGRRRRSSINAALQAGTAAGQPGARGRQAL